MRKKKDKKGLKSSVLLSIKKSKDCFDAPFECDLHLNLWKHANDSYSLDFGLMLYDIVNSKDQEHTFESIRLYLPYQCDKKDFIDLGKTLNSNNDMVSTVFNESYKEESGPDKSSMKKYVSNVNSQMSFYIYEIGPNDIEAKSIDGCDGTFLTITIPMADELKNLKFNLYLRFRINIKKTESVMFIKHDEHIANNVLQAAFSRMELYDCRFNDLRNTEDKIYQELVSKDHYNLLLMRKVHFFFMTDAKDYIANGNMERMDTRMLEIVKWKEYMDMTPKHAYVAYHWKKTKKSGEDNISSFEVFFRDTCNNKNVLLICSYIFLAVALGMTGSLMSTIDFSKVINWTGIVANVVLYLIFLITYCIDRWK